MNIVNSLARTESGGNWSARNNERGAGGQNGHFGRLQFGHARLTDAMNAGVLPRGTTPDQFMASPQLQEAVEKWHFADIDRQAARMGLNQYIGQEIGGVMVTPDAIRSMAHLGGIGGAAKFLQSGGAYNPSDSFGTSLAHYGRIHGGAGDQSGPQATPQQPQAPAEPQMPQPQQQPPQHAQNALAQTPVWQPNRNALDAQALVALDPSVFRFNRNALA